MLSRGEKETIKRGFQIYIFTEMLKDEFKELESENISFAGLKRDLSSMETYIRKASTELFKKMTYKRRKALVRELEDEIRMVNSFKLNAVIVKDDPAADIFYSKFAACYISVRDLYFSYKDREDEHEKKAMKWIKSAWTIINRVFKEHAEDGDLDWGDMKEKLDKKKDEYNFEIYMVAY
jgi:hypothetical protein